jgi:hypothetical protein
MLSTEIRVKGHIDKHWSENFEGLVVDHCKGDISLLSGSIADQAALYGLLARLWDFKLELVSIVVQEKLPD